MKYQEKYAGMKEECFESIKEVFSKLIKEKLEVEDELVEIPDDKPIELKVKYEKNDEEGQLAIKMTWSYLEEEEEEEEEEEDMDLML